MSILYDNTRDRMLDGRHAPARLSSPAVSGMPHQTSLAYRPTPALARATVEGFVERLSKKDAIAAAAVADQFSRNDYGSIYRRLVAPLGLRDGDAADALAAYTVLSWMIATGASDPSATAVRATRNQIGARMAADPRLGSTSGRARAGEEFKLLFVTLHAGWQSAQREGNLRQYADGVATLFKSRGTDLRALRLTSSGLSAR